ncbi:MAG: AsnC family transcriptional regulator [Desulfovibrio sp.]|jgi:DNA-binding Lrp family transcriptional regulator|nr:AsnC family transcriptional regulator [Desulfovibrio sp.]
MEQARRESGERSEGAGPDVAPDAHDRRILGIIQSAFPLEPRPYAVIGREVGLSEEEVFARVRRLKANRIIRRLGANFQSSRLGFHSTLCAAKVPEEAVDAFAAELHGHVGVTHNYLRNHAYNVWFTCIGPSREEVCALLDGISRKTGIAILNLPAKRLYKIKVDFQMD